MKDFHEEFWNEMQSLTDIEGYENRYTKYRSEVGNYCIESFFLFPLDRKSEWWVMDVEQDKDTYRLEKLTQNDQEVLRLEFNDPKEMAERLRRELFGTPRLGCTGEQMTLF